MSYTVRAGSTYCFLATGSGPAQLVRVELDAPGEQSAGEHVSVTLSGPEVVCAQQWQGRLERGQPATAEVAFVARPGRPHFSEGEHIAVDVIVSGPSGKSERSSHDIVAHEPGWTMYMVSHFHYDPVWWNTQAGYTSAWDELLWAQENRDTFQHNGLVLVEAHLERARLDPGYKFVLAEVDYLQPFWHLYPDRRAEIRALLEQGRLEIVGGTYNEPNTNLVGYETAARCAVYGMGFQRDVMGADPVTAWQLDVFAHDPSFPSLMARAGARSSSWARGPFHQWGPKHHTGSTEWMQFPSEFEWLGPDGRSLVTSYMADHYSAGWQLDAAATLEDAMAKAYELFCDLASVSAGRSVMLPVGTDYTPPNRWVTELAREWSSRYLSPAFVPALPKEFFAALDAERASHAVGLLPQSREMGPIYTGKDVSFIDTKQANRLAEHELAEAETWATLALGLGYAYPERALDKAWRQLVFNSHHDGITGSESDQVYIDLLSGWREAYELARGAKRRALSQLSLHIAAPAPAPGAQAGDGIAVVVYNRMARARSGLVQASVPLATGNVAAGTRVVAPTGAEVPCVATAGRSEATIEFFAVDVPALGWRAYHIVPGTLEPQGWEPIDGYEISNEHYRVVVDPARGGCTCSIVELSSGRELLAPGEVANELVVYDEYPTHPQMSEGPWHLMPRGEVARSSRSAAVVAAQRSPLGERLLVSGEVAGERFAQVVTLLAGQRRVGVRTDLHDYRGVDRLVRLRFGFCQPGATPLAETGQSVIGRSRGMVSQDSAQFPWTLDSPAQNWAGMGPCLVAQVSNGDGGDVGVSVGVGEVVLADDPSEQVLASTRALLVSLLQKGVTASCATASSNRYGGLSGDSNMPDFRLAIGGPQANAFTAAVLAAAGDAVAAYLGNELSTSGRARVYIPAQSPPGEGRAPVVDVRSCLDLPVVVVCGATDDATSAEVSALASEIAHEGVFSVRACPGTAVSGTLSSPSVSVAVLNNGTPGYVVGEDGALYVSLLRSCTAWPSGVWIDPPRRSAPDGSNFELEHWDHVFSHAIVGGEGDWRGLGIVREGRDFNAPFATCVVRQRSESTGGGLEAEGSFLQCRTTGGEVELLSMKPYGHRLARGIVVAPPGSDDARGPDGLQLSLRAYETSGFPASISLTSGAFSVEAASACDLMETAGSSSAGTPEPAREDGSIPLGPCEVVTVYAKLGLGSSLAGVRGPHAKASGGGRAPEDLLALECETAQPVYSRYWLHNRGPAPLGNALLSVHVDPMAVCAVPGQGPLDVSVTVSSAAASGNQEGELELTTPDGWVLQHSPGIFSLAPGAYRRVNARLTVPHRCRPGRYFVLARVVDAFGQRTEDVLTVDVLGSLGRPVWQGRQTFSPDVTAEMELALDATVLRVPTGGAKATQLRLRNRTKSEIHGEVQLVSPWETWAHVGPWVQPFSVPPGGTELCTFEAAATVDDRSLRSWCLLKVMYYGRVWYSPSVLLEIGERGDYGDGPGR